MTHRWAWLGLGLLATGWPADLAGCNVPVFRYALERWNPDTYQAVIFHRQPLQGPQQAAIETLNKAAQDGLVNLAVEVANVEGPLSEAQRILWTAQSNPPLPWVVVQYPESDDGQPSVWKGPLGGETAALILESPARRELARRLTQGTSAVWLLLECGDKARDAAVARLLETELPLLEKNLKLPELTPEDPQVRSDLPLKIAFSVLRVARGNPLEHFLVGNLLRVEKELAEHKEPMVFVVFGRGRSLLPLAGKYLEAPTLTDVAEFLVGACSCEVKSMNPGFDLLMTADWDAILGGNIVQDAPPPPLIGMAQFAAAGTTAAAPALTPATSTPSTNGLAGPAAGGSVRSNLLVVLGVGLVTLALATFAIRARFRTPSQ